MTYQAAANRYDSMPYRRCGKSGLKLPALSLGLWHNFGSIDVLANSRAMILGAFDLGITHFDLANNYGPEPGSAEETFGTVLRDDLQPHRDELVISTKAGYRMWPGPYGEWGSRKNLISSLDQSLARMGLDYVDIFYSHRFDPETPLEETMGALDSIVRQGKALYVGISSYDAEQTRQASAILRELGTPCLIHQPRYSMLHRAPEGELQAQLAEEGMGTIAFCPLAQGLLTSKYIDDIPTGSRAARPHTSGLAHHLTPAMRGGLRGLNDLAAARDQSLAQMALAWVLRDERITSALIGASRPAQIEENVAGLRALDFADDELTAIDALLNDMTVGQ